ncbi:DUF488 domain-containing protein [Salinicoccus jeotgali]|uniref:DUF488 domain-containing protein n=1 Tax=Salinicoccus jeotgali TaxID=381634 RepID=A0ABP7F9F5_9STAP
MLKTKRVYDDPSSQDGKRILVDGVWPRGIKKEDLGHDEWYKSLAPSNDLRKWFNHDPDKWETFKKDYFKELKENKELLETLQKESDGHNVTLLYSAKDTQYNQAEAIKEYVENMR